MTFTMRYGLYEYLVMSFVLTNAPCASTFHLPHELNFHVGVGPVHRGIMVFIDDILVYSNNIEEHEDHL
jgi:hypothetical protein